MPDSARDPGTLAQLREQRSRLADRIRAPWWYLAGIGFMWALVFAAPFATRYLPRGAIVFPPIVIVGLAVACLLQWGQTRATGGSCAVLASAGPASAGPASADRRTAEAAALSAAAMANLAETPERASTAGESRTPRVNRAITSMRWSGSSAPVETSASCLIKVSSSVRDSG